MRKPTYAVYPTEAERAQLRALIGPGAAPARMLTHAHILDRLAQLATCAGRTCRKVDQAPLGV